MTHLTTGDLLTACGAHGRGLGWLATSPEWRDTSCKACKRTRLYRIRAERGRYLGPVYVCSGETPDGSIVRAIGRSRNVAATTLCRMPGPAAQGLREIVMSTDGEPDPI